MVFSWGGTIDLKYSSQLHNNTNLNKENNYKVYGRLSNVAFSSYMPSSDRTDYKVALVKNI